MLLSNSSVNSEDSAREEMKDNEIVFDEYARYYDA